jgi:hypothetical protein
MLLCGISQKLTGVSEVPAASIIMVVGQFLRDCKAQYCRRQSPSYLPPCRTLPSTSHPHKTYLNVLLLSPCRSCIRHFLRWFITNLLYTFLFSNPK